MSTLKNPFVAAAVAFFVTAIYIKFKYVLNSMGKPSNSEMIKPGILVAILTGLIVGISDVNSERPKITQIRSYDG